MTLRAEVTEGDPAQGPTRGVSGGVPAPRSPPRSRTPFAPDPTRTLRPPAHDHDQYLRYFLNHLLASGPEGQSAPPGYPPAPTTHPLIGRAACPTPIPIHPSEAQRSSDCWKSARDADTQSKEEWLASKRTEVRGVAAGQASLLG
ncbi:hypothetical protein EW053_29600 [Streptomyces sp. IB2014 016-6]|nr:hypothetical protein EW053_29600 [Streptomyces sp. IB2014 016-6]